MSTKYPNIFTPIYLESQSEMHMGMDVITPAGVEQMTPAGFEPLETCHYPTFLTDYQSTRRSISTTTDHCESRDTALHLLRETLEVLTMEGMVQGSSTHDLSMEP